MYFVSLAISITNFIFEKLLDYISEFEKPHTKTSQLKLISNIMKIFLVEYINTAVILVIMNSKIDVILFNIPIIDGHYSEFSVEWYQMIGSTIVLTMFIRILTA